jgi:hypothetical protein
MMTPQLLLHTALSRALLLAQALDALHAGQHIHGGLQPKALEFLADGSLRMAPAQAVEDRTWFKPW